MNCNLSLKCKKSFKIAAKRSLDALACSWIREFTKCLSIRQKIGFGFGLAIGIVILGTTTGRILESFYWDQAREKLEKIDAEAFLLVDLQRNLLQIHNHEQKLNNKAVAPSLLILESSALLGEIKVANHLLNQIQLVNQSPANDDNEEHRKIQLLRTYQRVLQTYAEEVQRLLEVANQPNLSSKQAEVAQQAILAFPNSPTATHLDRLSERLKELADHVETKEERIYIEMSQAQQIATLILLSSLLISTSIAAALSTHISGVIALPIKVTTQVARHVTETSNFNLWVPVTTHDEVGQLATSLNQLIQWMKTYTQELHDTQAQLIQAEKMSSLGQMVAGIAHEINNPINFIHGNVECANQSIQDLLYLLELYQQQYPQNPLEFQAKIEALEPEFMATDLPKMLESIRVGAERIRQLVISLRNFSRLDEAEVKDIDLHEGIESTLLILNHRLKNGITLVKDYGKIPTVNCYPAQLNQVFMNILNNAVDALLERQDLSPKQITIQTRQISFNQVQVRIRDNGLGIPTQVKDKIFDPFFTTKDVGKGTGLGLAICYQIIQKHSGTIKVHSQINQGTEFAINLPVRLRKLVKV